MIPVSVLTGFLGSGKTTLLGHLLRQPGFARTAVVINEYGEIGLDHDLIEKSDESFVELTTGCLCCRVRGDLVRTLGELLERRRDGSVPPFERIVIETSGLADPAPILHALMTDRDIADRLTLAGVVTTVDAVHGAATLEREAISVKQVAVADRLILTKTDLVAGSLSALNNRMARLNPAAPRLISRNGRIDPACLLDASPYDPITKSTDAQAWLNAEGHASAHGHAEDRHDADVSTFVIVREAPIRAVTLTLFLETLAEHCGAGLLRVKGILHVTESPDRPAVIHGVQHVFHPPKWLERWPSEDRRSRIVFIVRGVPRSWVEALLDALEAEVGEVSTDP